MATTRLSGPHSLAAVEGALRSAWRADTSSDPSQWSAENPAWGQCAVTSLLLQDLFGGQLLRAEVDGISHYWLRLEDGSDIDLTRQQFGADVSVGGGEPRDRDYVLGYPMTRRRYGLLRRRVEASLARAA